MSEWNETPHPRRPRQISKYALACLETLAAHGMGQKVSLGGALGLTVHTHLARIAAHRPLEQIPDPADRAAAERVRTWFATEFLDALVD